MRTKFRSIWLVFLVLITSPLYSMEEYISVAAKHHPATEQELQKLARIIQHLNNWIPTQELAPQKDGKGWLVLFGMMWMWKTLKDHQVYDDKDRLDIRLGLFGYVLDRMFLQEQRPVEQAAWDKVMQKITNDKIEGNICALEEALIEELAIPIFGWLKPHLK